MEGHKPHDSMDALDDVGSSQVSHSADMNLRAIAAIHAATVRLLRLFVCLHVRVLTINCSCMRKIQKEKNRKKLSRRFFFASFGGDIKLSVPGNPLN